MDNSIAVKSVALPPPLHNDPADRIIVASARVLGATLLTQDDRIIQSGLVPILT
jgi:PIN domain nuclease of toxin-antitoxin system